MEKWWMRWFMVLLLACGGAGALLGQTAAAPQAEPSQAKPPELLPQAPPVSPADNNAAPAARPGEVYQQALKPLDLVRSSLDNWSDAELGALTAGIHMAREACGEISIGMAGEQDLFDLIRLCALGQDWTRSNTAALTYISSGAVPHRTQAYAMSINASVHMNDLDGAVKTALQMLHDVPYDAEVGYSFQFLKTYLTQAVDSDALMLAKEEHIALVEALKSGSTLHPVHGDAVMGSGTLFESGMQLAFLERYAGDPVGAERTCADLESAVAQATAVSATDRQLMDAVRKQYALLGKLLPAIDTLGPVTKTATAATFHPDAGFVTILAVFPDYCPQCAKAMGNLTEFAAEHVAAKVHAYGLMVREDEEAKSLESAKDGKPKVADGKDNSDALKGTATQLVTAKAVEGLGAVEFPWIVVTDERGTVYFVGTIPQNAFVPNGFMEMTVGRIVGEAAAVRNSPAGKVKVVARKPS